MNKNRIGIWMAASFLICIISYLCITDKYLIIIKHIVSLNMYWLLCALLCVCCYWLIEAKIINNIIIKLHGRQKYKDALKVSMIGQFFSGITPFATGGQPAQLILLTRQGVPVGKGSSSLVNKFIVYQGTLVIYSLILLILKARMFINNIDNLFSLVILGFCVNAAVIGMLLFLSMSRKAGRGIGGKVISLLSKLKIIKDEETSIKNFKIHIEEFHQHVIILLERKKILYQTLFATVVQLTLFLMIPYFIYRSFGLSGVHVLDIVAATAFVLMITSFIPLPGGSGGAEGGFYLIFGLFFLSKYILSGVIIWRVLTYYIWILIGGVWMLFSKSIRTEIRS